MSARSSGRNRPSSRGGGESARNARLRAQAAAQAAAARRRRTRVLLVLVGVAVLVVVLGIVVGPRLSGSSTGSAPLVAPTTVAAPQRSAQPPVTGRPVVLAGDAGATHVLTVWADFSCSHCRDFATDYGDVLERAAEQGQVRVELMPVTFVAPPSSVRAANAFACAAEGGFGPAYHDALFASFRTDWDDEQLVALAERVAPGSDLAGCLDDSRHQPYLDSVDQAAQAAGVDATPTVLLDGAPLPLAQTTPADLAATLQETP
ncbi:DsbA family protein [Auraticoccus monumenti]|uniref:Protein-disulfide isomerase n=1 Tax=Auraticoccus monumenti TaxID=675864 RepID=A0A1G7B6W0_9ACTN|nr:thioredoxin domain-containing protein [Auraticoccus monumenti]SDE22036.1 Protein-disulfide isomerase [Auraticoccus monumenti]